MYREQRNTSKQAGYSFLSKVPLSKYMAENSVGQENQTGFLEIKISLMDFAIAPLT
jgi:hypothetical protein